MNSKMLAGGVKLSEQLIVNPYFTDSSGWELAGDFTTITGGQLLFVANGGSTSAMREKLNALCFRSFSFLCLGCFVFWLLYCL